MKAIRFMAVGVLLALAACSKPAPTEKAADVPAVPGQAAARHRQRQGHQREALRGIRAVALARRPLSELSPEDREQIKENLVRVELIAQEAEKSGLVKDPDVATRLELARLEVLQQGAAQKYMKDHTATEAEMRAEFEAQIASAPLVEFQARHILVSSEDVAQKIIAQLKAGNDFAGAGQAHVGRQGLRGERRRPRLVRPPRHGSRVHQRRGVAEERRIHHDAGADRGSAGT